MTSKQPISISRSRVLMSRLRYVVWTHSGEEAWSSSYWKYKFVPISIWELPRWYLNWLRFHIMETNSIQIPQWGVFSIWISLKKMNRIYIWYTRSGRSLTTLPTQQCLEWSTYLHTQICFIDQYLNQAKRFLKKQGFISMLSFRFVNQWLIIN